MSKRAEQKALEAYPDFSPDGKWQQSRRYERIIYKNGYEQAEKDLELTWGDMQLIWRLCDTLNSEQPNLCSSKDFFTEVLDRFNKSKEKK